MGALDGRVALITGAGRGIGREHALLFAREGARVVVNDVGGAPDGAGSDVTAAQSVVDEIVALGGDAVANTDDVTTLEGGRRMVQAAVEAFGGLHVLVANAGILRDRPLVTMTEEEWDSVVSVHLKGHFCPIQAAAAYWREQSKAGNDLRPAVVATASGAALAYNEGQTNYGAAKAGIAAFSLIAAKELSRYGVRVNVLAPMARTRLTLQTPGMAEVMSAPAEAGAFDFWDPANIAPLAAYLATDACPLTGGVFHVVGNQVGLFTSWTLSQTAETTGPWTIDDLQKELAGWARPAGELASGGTTLESLTATIAKALG